MTATKLKVAFYTLGCKLNQAETELVARQFGKAGYTIVDDGADVCVVNTCTVTHIADRKSRHLLRLLRKTNPEAWIIATGCYAERSPQELARVGANLVIGNEQKAHLLDVMEGEHVLRTSCTSERPASDGVGRVRSFIKIQDGCDDCCAYCIVPSVRGSGRCLSVADIVAEVKAIVAAGYREVVLTGTKIGDYEDSGNSLGQLLGQILAATGVERLQVSSLQPQDISEEFISLWQDSRLCRHFHLALQSGSDAVLERMRRNYSVDAYGQAVSIIRRNVPDVSITTDIIVGFPGESPSEFEESFRFCREIDFANIHVFAYSRRPGTSAANLPGQINEKEKKERSLRMLKLARDSGRKFHQRFVGRNTTVLWEKEVPPGSGVYSGLSDNYIRVFAEAGESLTNELLSVRLVRLHDDGIWGEIVR
jgi:threonylcarbamoyladenosine tRNA methylthiotransferase MtaB